MAVLFTTPLQQFFDDNGTPLAGGKIYSYIAGTTTPKPTYTDHTGSTQLSNPVVLDSSGRAVVFIQGSYRFDIKDSADNLIRTIDNVTSFTNSEASGSAFFDKFSGDGVTTTFTLSTSLGTDENSVMVFINKSMQDYVTNGNFDTDTSWTKGAGWTISAGVATATGAISTALSQTSPLTLEVGKAYRVTYTVTRSAGGIIPSIGGNSGTERTASGTYTEIIICGSSQTVAFTGNAFTGTVDTVTIKNLDLVGYDIQNPSTYTLNGTSLTFAQAPATGTDNIFVVSASNLVGAASAAADEAINAENGALDALSAAQDIASAFAGSNVNYIPASGVSGTGNAIILTSSTPITSLYAGIILTFMATSSNTTAVTIDLNGLGAKPVVRNGVNPLITNDITSNMPLTVQYDGTSWQILGMRTIRAVDIGTAQIGTVKLGSDITTAGKSILSAADADAQSVLLGTVKAIRRTVITSTAGFTPDANLLFADIEMCGGGGGGGAVNANNNAAGGGGAAGYLRFRLTSAQMTALGAITATIGAAGAAGTAGGAGGNGGASSFSTAATTNGGSGGGAGNAGGVAGGAGGSVTLTTGTSILNIAGQAGGYSFATTGQGVSGDGANTPIGIAGQTVSAASVSVAGIAGNGYGSGGSGAARGSAGSSVDGGAGAAGVIIVTEFCSK